MRLSTGDKLGRYEITGLIGKGGMGEVYKGTDTRLGRPVAIKVSSREFNDRFERSARVAATNLNDQRFQHFLVHISEFLDVQA